MMTEEKLKKIYQNEFIGNPHVPKWMPFSVWAEKYRIMVSAGEFTDRKYAEMGDAAWDDPAVEIAMEQEQRLCTELGY